MSDTTTLDNRGSLDRFLNLFTEVRSGESAQALALALNIFLILTAYYILKPVREALILATEGGAELKSYVSAGQVVLFLFLVPLYGWLASRFPRRQLISRVTLFFVACLGVFYALAVGGAPIGVVFFLWIGIFNMMVPAQFWAFANDLYNARDGERLFVIVAFGASAGAVFGSALTGRLIEPLGVYPLLLLSGAILLASLGVTLWVDSHARVRGSESKGAAGEASPGAASAATPTPADQTLGDEGAFRVLFRSRYLVLIALLMLFLNWVNTTGEYILGRTVVEAAEAAVAQSAGAVDESSFIARFYADFFAVVNVLGLLLQLFVVSRVLKYLGLGVAILILPLIALGGYAIAAFLPVLAIIRWVKTAENATDYSLNNTVRQALFLPCSREEKYKAKQAIDTLFVRAGDVLSAALVFLGTVWLSFSTQQFALVNIALVVVWLALAFWIGREYRRRVGSGGVPSPDEAR